MNKLIAGLAASMFVLAAHAQTPTAPAASATEAHAKKAPHKHAADKSAGAKAAKHEKHTSHKKPAATPNDKPAV